MIPVPRWAVSVVALMFCVFPAAIAMIGFNDSTTPALLVVAVILYLAGLIPTLSLFAMLKLPLWLTIFNLGISIVVPAMLLPGIHPAQAGDYSTWFVGAIGSLSAATAFRDRIAFSLLMVFFVSYQVVMWGGPGSIMGTGVVGAVIFFIVGALMSKGIRGTQSAAEEYREKLRKTLANASFVTAAREEHKHRIADALVKSVPLLREIEQVPGEFSPGLKQRSGMLEASLRDEIRGRGLINEAIKKSVMAARGRGIEVILLDEGGLDEVSSEERDVILQKAAVAIDSVREGRITLRAPQAEQWRITLVATRSGVTAPDLWLKF